DGGGLLSGGEGQRVRLGRAMLRPGVRLAILDEPFRGLDRERRRELLARARRAWPGATLLCVTHDVGETRAFGRVLVVDGGDGGGLLSGGEGQRVRLGRAMLRPGVRLAILDEPFRGLDRERRRELLARARRAWPGATLLCVTHDVGETRAFGRVLVVDGGRVV